MRRRLEHARELLDAPGHDPAELEQSLQQVAEVNRLLGGTRALLRTLDGLAPPSGELRILDVGTGSADLPLAIDRWGSASGRIVRITATDVHPQILEIARAQTRDIASIRVEAADALDLPYPPASFDIVLLSLTLHHFERADQIRALRAAARTARLAVVVNELERGLPNYIGARLLAHTRWRGNRLTRHDGPLSVLRAFRMRELREIAAAAGVPVRSVRRHLFFRLIMVLDGGRSAPS